MENTDDVIDYLLFEARIDLKRATHRVCFLLKCRGESEMAEDTVIRLVEPVVMENERMKEVRSYDSR